MVTHGSNAVERERERERERECVYVYVRIYSKTYTSSSRNSLDGGSHRVQGLWSEVLNRGVIQRSIPGVIQGELGVQTIAHACVCGSSKNRGGASIDSKI